MHTGQSKIATGIVLYTALALPLWSQSPIRGPMLGWVWDARQESIRPILGIAGSSVLGKGAEVGFAVKHAAMQPGSEQALAVGGDARELYALDLRAEPVQARKLEAPGGAQTIVLSPRGTAAAVWYGESKKLLIVTAWDGAAPGIREIDLSVEGKPARWAVSDDGGLLAALYGEQRRALLVDGDGNRWSLPKEGDFSALAFLERSRDLLVAAEDGIFLVTNSGANSTLRRVSEVVAAPAVAASDSGRVLALDPANQTVLEFGLESGEVRSAECPCAPTGLVRMTSGGVFRLNEYAKGPLWLVEIRDSGLRTLFVPPDPSDPDLED